MHQWHIIGKEIEGRPWRQPFPGPENKHWTSPKCQSVPFLLTLAAWEFFLLLSSRGKDLVFSYFFLNLAAPRGMQDLSTLTQDGTHALALKVPCPNHWTTREVPGLLSSLVAQKEKKLLPKLWDCDGGSLGNGDTPAPGGWLECLSLTRRSQ